MNKLGVVLALLLGIVLISSVGYGIYHMAQEMQRQVTITIEQGLNNLDR